ncbi:unnamed protein product [Allacma fusca]|uniref:Uncharacterized protein n=1 Tax=Allacma fusca TaxID=39272 RepID=A0A8J2JK26_9HEXA|nr:unnamed protein product [Allacma fusca]
MAGWPRYYPGQQGYPGGQLQPEMPVYAPGPITYDQGFYGGNAVPSMNPEFQMNNPPDFYPYQNPAPPEPLPGGNSHAHSQEFIPPGPPTPAGYHPAQQPPGPVPQTVLNPGMAPQTNVPLAPNSVQYLPGPKVVSNPTPPVNFGAIPVPQREAEILDFWKQRFTVTEPGQGRPFPDKFVLRLVVGLDKRAVEALELIFKEANKSSLLIFEEDPPSKGNVPSHLKCLGRCRWDSKQNWIVGYGATPAEAKNEVAVEALKQLLTPEEYSLIVEINRPERFISLDAQKLAQSLNQYALSTGKTSRKRKGSESLENSSFPFEYKQTTDVEGEQDSDYSIGGSGSELTGEEDECDSVPPEKMKLIKLRKNLYTRENRIIKYWLSKRPDPVNKPFPDLFRLRNMRNVGKRARSAVLILFQSFQRHLRPVFQQQPNTRPDLGYFHVRCSWDNFKQNIYGYGNTTELAENDAGIKALMKVMGDAEYALLDEMTREELYTGLDMARIHAHIAYRSRPDYKNSISSQPSSSKTTTTPGFNFESELLNYPRTLRKFPSIGLAEPIPSYTATNNFSKNTVKVECVARGKYFVEEATTEESAKNSAALSALKFLVGEEGLEKILKADMEKSKS